jgi:hypothetical protein
MQKCVCLRFCRSDPSWIFTIQFNEQLHNQRTMMPEQELEKQTEALVSHYSMRCSRSSRILWSCRGLAVLLAVDWVRRAPWALAKPITFPLIPHWEVERRRIHEGRYPPRELEQVAGLFHGFGTHYVDLWCGTPTPQRQTVIVDTGSGSTAFPCSTCADCGVPEYHIDPLYQETLSESFRPLTCLECLEGACSLEYTGGGNCGIDVSYVEGSSWSAYEAVDTCYLGGLHNTAVPIPRNNADIDAWDPLDASAFTFPLKFGCQTRLTGFFQTQLEAGMYVSN